MQKGCSYIACHIIANLLDEKFTLPVTLSSSALLCVHIMSGCDTVSYVFGKGKKKSFTVAMANASEISQQRTPSGTTCYEPCTRLSSARKLTCPHFPYLMLHYMDGTFGHLASIKYTKYK